MKIRVMPMVLCGKIEPIGARGHSSGIAKVKKPGPWVFTRAGIAGDAQADRKHHGGPDKAVHHYAFDHYPTWRAELGDHRILKGPGAFGENFSTICWTEQDVCIGDVVRFGDALLQVSQGRQPCWKLNVRFGRNDLAYRCQMSGRTGWYYRVIEEGEATPGALLKLVHRSQPEWSLFRVLKLLYHDKHRYDDLAAMAELQDLSREWRSLAARRLETHKVENWDLRLNEQHSGMVHVQT